MSGGQTAGWPKWLRDLAFVAVTVAAGTALLMAIMVLGHDLWLTGSAADWLATLCNAVVAIAAVAAFRVARSWLPQMTTQEGYKTAIALVNDCYSQLGDTHPPTVAAARALEVYGKTSGGDVLEGYQRYEDAINQFRVELVAAMSVPAQIKSTRFALDTYGLTEAPRYKDALETMVTAFEASFSPGETLLKQLQNDLKRRQEGPGESYSTNSYPAVLKWRARLQEEVPKIETQYQRYTEATKKFQAAHAAVFGGRPSISDLFVSRKHSWLSWRR